MKPVRIYTADYCPYCRKAKQLLQERKIPFQEIDVTQNKLLREELEEKTGWMTVPMIFFGEDFLGGYDRLADLDAQNQLFPALE